ncbi:hypothetical protein A0H81_08518 [Grifola frondosa]|uniref:Uncharacterized protein n=1 Tax=Grifola frondosa TaxID=5627 RepID=A0A1C7M3M1_GRIFR|nr:hypothetical protein A0H81_08518 [Grifola frondosa]
MLRCKSCESKYPFKREIMNWRMAVSHQDTFNTKRVWILASEDEKDKARALEDNMQVYNKRIREEMYQWNCSRCMDSRGRDRSLEQLVNHLWQSHQVENATVAGGDIYHDPDHAPLKDSVWLISDTVSPTELDADDSRRIDDGQACYYSFKSDGS